MSFFDLLGRKAKMKKDENEDSPNKALIEGVVENSQESENMPPSMEADDQVPVSDDEIPGSDVSEENLPDSGGITNEVNAEEFSDADSETEEMPGDEDSIGDIFYIAGDGDSIGSQVGQAVLQDDEVALHEISSAINDGQEMFIDWLENNGGHVISAGGDEFVGIAPVALHEQLEDFREAYAQVVGATLTIGIGHSMSEAGKALIFGKLHGKDQIVEFAPEMDQFLMDIQGQKPTGEEKYNEQYLDATYGEDPEMADEGQDQEMVNPEAIEEMAPDLEQSEEDQVNSLEKDETSLRDKMLSVVESFQSEKEAIEASKDQNPELYQAFMQTLQSMIDLARKIEPQEEQAPEQEPQPQEEQPAMDEQLQGKIQG